MKSAIYLLGLTVLLSTFSACDSLWIQPSGEGKPTDVFQELWYDLDQGYVFFDEKQVDWDQIRTVYEPQVTDDMSERELFEVLRGMLSELRDGHVSLDAGFDLFLYDDLYLDYASNYNLNFVEYTYLDNQQGRIGPFVYALLNEEVGYLRYAAFGSNFTEEDLDFLMTYFAGTKGLILDLRDNLGGATDNVSQLMHRFVPGRQEVGQMITPDAIDSPDGTPGPVFVGKDDPELLRFLKPTVLLTNRKCFSACTVFAGFMSQLDQVTIIGDTTGGGTGSPVGNDLSNGWKYRYSVGNFVLLDGRFFEAGLPPDLVVTTGPDEELQGEDAIIEAAIKLIQQ